MADVFHDELGRTLRAAGFYADHPPDAHFAKWKDGKQVVERPEFGRADFIFMGWGSGGAAEAKTGRGEHRQSWPFSEWKPHQRKWAELWRSQYNNEYWLYITVGTIIPRGQNHKVKYPRITVLLPSEEVIRLEQESKRKSLSYEQIAAMTEYRLEWAGNKTWSIPPSHPFWTVYRREIAGGDSNTLIHGISPSSN